MSNKQQKMVEWILRIGVAGEFLGHGMLGLQAKAQWVTWIQQITGADAILAGQLIVLIGLLDVFVAIVVLLRPIKIVVLWAALWGFWTALLRPLVGEAIWDFVERFANWGAPLSLLLLLGWPRKFKEWLR